MSSNRLELSAPVVADTKEAKLESNDFAVRAKKVKQEIAALLADQKLALVPQSKRRNAFHNPIALEMKNGLLSKLSKNSQDFIKECESSAKLLILESHLTILQKFYNDRKKVDDKLGNLYKTLSFEDFILRLFNKRFKEVYLDGRVIVGRDNVDANVNKNLNDHVQDGAGSHGRGLLEHIGSSSDQVLYKHYLTLEEMVLSPLVLAQTTSIVIGTGNRSEEKDWDVKKEFEDAIDIATFSYPAAAEFRNGHTAHYDLLYISQPPQYWEEQQNRVKRMQNNSVIHQAALSIYGKRFATDSKIYLPDEKVTAMIALDKDTYYLHNEAYITRTAHVLRQVLICADIEMANAKLGTTFQLKGLGLGAFAFTGPGATEQLEKLYLKALEWVLSTCTLKHIKKINLINLPTTFPKLKDKKVLVDTIKGIEVFKTDMDPTSAKRVKDVGMLGGTVFCGDSGSAVGNEGNRGLDRSSSDDPATQYSLLDPLILNPEKNLRLAQASCIHVVTQQYKFQKLSDYLTSKADRVTTDSKVVSQPALSSGSSTGASGVPAPDLPVNPHATLISYLNVYKAKREADERTTFHCLFRFFQYNKQEKLSAVDALLNVLDGKQQDLSSHINALRNARLGGLIRPYVKANGYKTVRAFLDAVQKNNKAAVTGPSKK